MMKTGSLTLQGEFSGKASTVLPQSAAGQILPKCGYHAGILFFPKMQVRSIQNAGI